MKMQQACLPRTFILGVGAQKAGTTWVQEYAKNVEHADFGYLKEYHVWDSLTIPELVPGRSRVRRGPIKKLLTFLEVRLLRLPRAGSVRKYFRDDTRRYFDYFQARLEPGQIRLTGDVTPAYAGLPADCFEYIRAEFERRGIHVKVVFLMRDPLERCWSGVRMRKQRKSGFEGERSDDEALLRFYKSYPCRVKTDYRATLETLSQVFRQEDLFIGFYEELFTESEIERLSTFLGVVPNYESLEVRHNQGKKSEQLSEETCRLLVEYYRGVYEYVSEQVADVSRLWPSARYLEVA